MADSPGLEIGKHRDVRGKVSVHLDAPGLKAHTAIIAQSGSGKSYMLGRLLEEIASKTLARVLILDPNADFIKFSEVNPSAWEQDKDRPDPFPVGDTLEEFRRRWGRVGFVVLTKWSKEALQLASNYVEVNRVSLNASGVGKDLWTKPAYLGLSPERDGDVISALHAAVAIMADPVKLGSNLLGLDQFYALTARWGRREGVDYYTTLDEHLRQLVKNAELPKEGQPFQAVVRLHEAVRRLRDFPIWSGGDLISLVSSWVQTDPKRVMCVDLASLGQPEPRLIVAHAALEKLWATATEQWALAVTRPAAEDDRVPVFVVIDEAHNLAPAEPTSELGKLVNEILVRIAMEGRKYGLFLVLVTQRPSRLNPNLLSQCDNLILMKTNNFADLRLAEKTFGFLPEGWAKKAADFKQGEALLSGRFVESANIHGYPRRTVEGGRSLRDGSWLRDPSPQDTPEDPASSSTAS